MLSKIYLYILLTDKNVDLILGNLFQCNKGKKKVMLCTLEFKVMIMKDIFKEGSNKKNKNNKNETLIYELVHKINCLSYFNF